MKQSTTQFHTTASALGHGNLGANTAPWLEALTTQEQAEMMALVGGLTTLTPREQVAFFLADFKITDKDTYLEGRKIPNFSDRIAVKIMDFCFANLHYVPMVYYNTRFSGGYVIEKRGAQCPNLALEDIVMDKVLGYREKIDGVLVFTARIAKEGAAVECWAGAMSCPKYVSNLHQFEVKGATCYSIEPFNAEGSLVFPGMEFTFVARQLEFSVSPTWREGAVALVATPAFPVEKRVKRIATGEVLVRGDRGVDDKGSYPMKVPVPIDGVWECAWDGSSLVPQAYRPWKQPCRNFFKVIGVPTVHALRAVAKREIHQVKGPLRATSNAIYLPPPLVFQPVLAAFLASPLAIPRVFRQATGGEPIDSTICYTGYDFQGAISPLVVTSVKPYVGAPQLGFSVPVSMGVFFVATHPFVVRSEPEIGAVITTASHKLVASHLKWEMVLAKGPSVEKIGEMTQTEFEAAYAWAIKTPYYAARYYKRQAAPAVSSCQRLDRTACALPRVDPPHQPTPLIEPRIPVEIPSALILVESIPDREYPRVEGDVLTTARMDATLGGASCAPPALYDRLRQQGMHISERQFSEWLLSHPEYPSVGGAIWPREVSGRKRPRDRDKDE